MPRSTPEDIHKSRGVSRPRSRGTPRAKISPRLSNSPRTSPRPRTSPTESSKVQPSPVSSKHKSPSVVPAIPLSGPHAGLTPFQRTKLAISPQSGSTPPGPSSPRVDSPNSQQVTQLRKQQNLEKITQQVKALTSNAEQPRKPSRLQIPSKGSDVSKCTGDAAHKQRAKSRLLEKDDQDSPLLQMKKQMAENRTKPGRSCWGNVCQKINATVEPKDSVGGSRSERAQKVV